MFEPESNDKKASNKMIITKTVKIRFPKKQGIKA